MLVRTSVEMHINFEKPKSFLLQTIDFEAFYLCNNAGKIQTDLSALFQTQVIPGPVHHAVASFLALALRSFLQPGFVQHGNHPFVS